MYIKKAICVISICLLLALAYLPLVEAGDVKITNIVTKSGKAYKEGDGGIDLNKPYYIDRAYIATTIPKDLKGAQWIMTANDDKNSVGADFLTFEVDRPVVVWIAHDSRGEKEKAGVPSEWLSKNFKHHPDMKMDVTDANMGFFTFWEKDFPKGKVTISGNADPPAAGHGSNYIVLILPNKKAEAVEARGKLGITWGRIKANF